MTEVKEDKWSIVQNKKDMGKECSPTPSEDIMSEGNNSEYSFQIYEESDILSSTSGETNSDFESLLGQGEMNHMDVLLNGGPSLDQPNLFDVDINGQEGFESNATLRDYQIEQLSNSMAVQKTSSNGKRTLDSEDDSNSVSKSRELQNEAKSKTKENSQTDESANTTNASSNDKKKKRANRKRAQKRKIKKAKLAKEALEKMKETLSTDKIEGEKTLQEFKEVIKNQPTSITTGVIMSKCPNSETTISSTKIQSNKPINESNATNWNKHAKKVGVTKKDSEDNFSSNFVEVLFVFLFGVFIFCGFAFFIYLLVFYLSAEPECQGKGLGKINWELDTNHELLSNNNEMLSADGRNVLKRIGKDKLYFESSLYLSTTPLNVEDYYSLSTEFWKPHGKYLIDFDSGEIYKLDITERMLNWYDGMVKQSKNQYDQFKLLVEKEMIDSTERLFGLKEYFETMKIKASSNAKIIHSNAKHWFSKYQKRLFNF